MHPGENSQEKHSRLGVASFIIALLTIAMYCGELLCDISNSQFLAAGHRGLTETVVLLVFLGCSGILINLIGIGLGIGGLAQKGRKKLFAAWGLILNLAAPVALICANLWIDSHYREAILNSPLP